MSTIPPAVPGVTVADLEAQGEALRLQIEGLKAAAKADNSPAAIKAGEAMVVDVKKDVPLLTRFVSTEFWKIVGVASAAVGTSGLIGGSPSSPGGLATISGGAMLAIIHALAPKTVG